VALGAQRSNVVRMVVREGMTLGLVGIIAGLEASYPLTRLMTSLQSDRSPDLRGGFRDIGRDRDVRELVAGAECGDHRAADALRDE